MSIFGPFFNILHLPSKFICALHSVSIFFFIFDSFIARICNVYWSFKKQGGAQQISEALAKKIGSDKIQLDQPVVAIKQVCRNHFIIK